MNTYHDFPLSCIKQLEHLPFILESNPYKVNGLASSDLRVYVIASNTPERFNHTGIMTRVHCTDIVSSIHSTLTWVVLLWKCTNHIQIAPTPKRLHPSELFARLYHFERVKPEKESIIRWALRFPGDASVGGRIGETARSRSKKIVAKYNW